MPNTVDESRVSDKSRGAVVIDFAAVLANKDRAYGLETIKAAPDSAKRNIAPLLMIFALVIFFALIARG